MQVTPETGLHSPVTALQPALHLVVLHVQLKNVWPQADPSYMYGWPGTHVPGVYPQLGDVHAPATQEPLWHSSNDTEEQ
ncbi:MAG: hypothetical protein V1725_06190 [archaeon]